MTTPLISSLDKITPFQTELKNLTKEGFLSGYLVVDKNNTLHQASGFRVLWENMRGYLGYTNRAEANKLKEAASKLISGNCSEINKEEESARLVIDLAKKTGLITKQEQLTEKNQLIQDIIQKALKISNHSENTNLTKKDIKIVADSKNTVIAKEVISQNPMTLNSREFPQNENIQRENKDLKDEDNASSEKEGEQQREEPSLQVIEMNKDKVTVNEFVAPPEKNSSVNALELQIPDAQPILPDAQPTLIERSAKDAKLSTEDSTSLPEDDKSSKAVKIDLKNESEGNKSRLWTLAKGASAIFGAIGGIYLVSNAMSHVAPPDLTNTTPTTPEVTNTIPPFTTTPKVADTTPPLATPSEVEDTNPVATRMFPHEVSWTHPAPKGSPGEGFFPLLDPLQDILNPEKTNFSNSTLKTPKNVLHAPEEVSSFPDYLSQLERTPRPHPSFNKGKQLDIDLANQPTLPFVHDKTIQQPYTRLDNASFLTPATEPVTQAFISTPSRKPFFEQTSENSEQAERLVFDIKDEETSSSLLTPIHSQQEMESRMSSSVVYAEPGSATHSQDISSPPNEPPREFNPPDDTVSDASMIYKYALPILGVFAGGLASYLSTRTTQPVVDQKIADNKPPEVQPAKPAQSPKAPDKTKLTISEASSNWDNNTSIDSRRQTLIDLVKSDISDDKIIGFFLSKGIKAGGRSFIDVSTSKPTDLAILIQNNRGDLYQKFFQAEVAKPPEAQPVNPAQSPKAADKTKMTIAEAYSNWKNDQSIEARKQTLTDLVNSDVSDVAILNFFIKNHIQPYGRFFLDKKKPTDLAILIQNNRGDLYQKFQAEVAKPPGAQPVNPTPSKAQPVSPPSKAHPGKQAINKQEFLKNFYEKFDNAQGNYHEKTELLKELVENKEVNDEDINQIFQNLTLEISGSFFFDNRIKPEKETSLTAFIKVKRKDLYDKIIEQKNALETAKTPLPKNAIIQQVTEIKENWNKLTNDTDREKFLLNLYQDTKVSDLIIKSFFEDTIDDLKKILYDFKKNEPSNLVVQLHKVTARMDLYRTFIHGLVSSFPTPKPAPIAAQPTAKPKVTISLDEAKVLGTFLTQWGEATDIRKKEMLLEEINSQTDEKLSALINLRSNTLLPFIFERGALTEMGELLKNKKSDLYHQLKQKHDALQIKNQKPDPQKAAPSPTMKAVPNPTAQPTAQPKTPAEIAKVDISKLIITPDTVKDVYMGLPQPVDIETKRLFIQKVINTKAIPNSEIRQSFHMWSLDPTHEVFYDWIQGKPTQLSEEIKNNRPALYDDYFAPEFLKLEKDFQDGKRRVDARNARLVKTVPPEQQTMLLSIGVDFNNAKIEERKTILSNAIENPKLTNDSLIYFIELPNIDCKSFFFKDNKPTILGEKLRNERTDVYNALFPASPVKPVTSVKQPETLGKPGAPGGIRGTPGAMADSSEMTIEKALIEWELVANLSEEKTLEKRQDIIKKLVDNLDDVSDTDIINFFNQKELKPEDIKDKFFATWQPTELTKLIFDTRRNLYITFLKEGLEKKLWISREFPYYAIKNK
jgi:hypothetical protein